MALIAVDSAMQVNLMPQRKVALALEVVAPQLKWNHQFEFAAYYAAVEKGNQLEGGIDVQLLEAGPGLNPRSKPC